MTHLAQRWIGILDSLDSTCGFLQVLMPLTDHLREREEQHVWRSREFSGKHQNSIGGTMNLGPLAVN
jgi:hypothetical protein